MDDAELLRRYLQDRSQAAFTELVQRHLPLVYRAALRQTSGNAAQAEEVAQAVFVRLARKASALSRHPTLVGWLHTTVYFTASELRRAARRRRRREQEASHMADIPSVDSPAADWSRIQPVIDEALQCLDGRDRDAILLRFFEGRAFGEIGIDLGLTEDAVRMRVNRALARIREMLSSRGIASTEAALAAILATEPAAALGAVPAGLTATVAQGAFVASGASAASANLLHLMAVKKSLIATAILAAAIGAATSAFLLRRHLWSAAAENRQLQSENDSLRDRLTAALLATTNSKPVGGMGTGSAQLTNAKDPAERLSAIHSQVRLREASRDALPTTVAHPLKFRGYDTPIHSVESFVWASYHSDAEEIARSLYLDPAARAAADRIRATLPPDVQAQYPTAESLIAMCIAYDVIRHPGPNSEDYFIDPPEPVYLDSADLKLPNGQIYHHTPDGWKYDFPARAVAGFVNNVINPKTSGP